MKTRRDRYEVIGLTLFAAALTGCIQNPSGASQQSTATVSISGATQHPGQQIDFYLRDRRGAAVGTAPAETLLTGITATTSMTEIVAGDGLYSFSLSIPTSSLPPATWIPQTFDGRSEGGLLTSVGRLEIVARPHGIGQTNLKTFTSKALTCANSAANQAAALACADGDSFLVYDNDGVGPSAPAAAAADFVQIGGSPFPLSGLAAGVDLQIGSYTVAGLSTVVNAVVCRPHTAGPPAGRRTVVLNHGGYVLDAGALDACVDWARAGWVAALTAYRYEAVTAVVPMGFPAPKYSYPPQIERPPLPAPPLLPGVPEICLGEVTDSLRWLDIVRLLPDTDDSQMLLWGYSHGACVTLRSLEQGAAVKAAVAVSSPTEFFMWDTFLTNTKPDDANGVHFALGGTPASLPDAYKARSAARLAVDLQRRSDVRLLEIAVQKDTFVHPSQGCLMANAIGAENHQMLPGGDYSPSSGSPMGIDFAGCITGYINWTGGAPLSWNKPAMFLLYANTSIFDGHAFFGYTTPPPPGVAWTLPLNLGIRDFLLASFP